MHKELSQTIEIPEGITITLEGTLIKIRGPEGEVEKKFTPSKLSIEKKGNEIIIADKEATKKEKRLMNTITAHLKNMIKGVQKKFEYKLKVCFSHFPISVEIKGREAIVKNFLGEKVPRKVELPEGAEVELNKDIITIKSCNREIAGQAAANLETITKIRSRDRRVFQDGIYIINKAGKEI